MNIGSIGAFSHAEFMKNVIAIKPGDREPGTEDLKARMTLNIPKGQGSDKYDYYVRYDPKIENRTLFTHGDTSLETAVPQVNPMSFNNDGTANVTSYEDRLQELRINGLSKEINWEMVDRYHFGLISNYSTEYQYSMDDTVKELAASYATLKNQIGQNFSGDELNEQMSMLDSIFTKHTEQLASSFSESVGEFVMGIEGEKEKLYQSVKAAVTQLAGEYGMFLQGNRDFANLKGTQNEWLSGHYRYLASAWVSWR